MKKYKNLTDFTCDQCSKSINNQDSFPYNKKWIYLYKLEFKVAQQDSNRHSDNHFCSLDCFKKYIQNIINVNKIYIYPANDDISEIFQSQIKIGGKHEKRDKRRNSKR